MGTAQGLVFSYLIEHELFLYNLLYYLFIISTEKKEKEKPLVLTVEPVTPTHPEKAQF